MNDNFEETNVIHHWHQESNIFNIVNRIGVGGGSFAGVGSGRNQGVGFSDFVGTDYSHFAK